MIRIEDLNDRDRHRDGYKTEISRRMACAQQSESADLRKQRVAAREKADIENTRSAVAPQRR